MPYVGITGSGWSDEESNLTLKLALDAKSTFFAHFKDLVGVQQASFSVSELDVYDKTEYETLEGFGFARPRMWAQYGDSHAGVCVVFSAKLVGDALDHYQAISNTRFLARKVQYKAVPIFNHRQTHFSGARIKNMGKAEFVRRMEETEGPNLLFTKHVDFANEQEFKICAIVPTREPLLVDVGGAVLGVILGASFPDTFYAAARQLSANQNLRAFAMSWSDSQPFNDELETHLEVSGERSDTVRDQEST